MYFKHKHVYKIFIKMHFKHKHIYKIKKYLYIIILLLDK